MPLTPDMPITPDDDEVPSSKPRSNGTNSNIVGRAAERLAANDAPEDDTFDDRGDVYESDEEEELEKAPASQSFSDMVREAPIGAVIGAFIAGFLVSRLL